MLWVRQGVKMKTNKTGCPIVCAPQEGSEAALTITQVGWDVMAEIIYIKTNGIRARKKGGCFQSPVKKEIDR